GVLSGVVNSLDNFSIDITASNSSGSDTFTTTVSVIANTPPYINGYAVDCYIDEDTCDFTFTDNADWRASVTLVTMGAPYGFGAETTLSSPVDYELSEGQLRLHFNANNQMVKSGGDYEITLLSNSYSEVNISVHVIEGEVILSYVNIDPALAVGTTSTFSMHAANRFGVPVTALYPELTQLNNDPTLVERFQYRQASDYGDSNIWKTFGNWNELAVDGDGNLSFDVKLPGCIDINDGFDLLAGNLSWIYRNIDEACKDVDWAIRYQLYTGDNRNIVIDSQHQMYRVLVDDHQLYLVKYDRNGIEKWTKTLTSNGTNWFEGIEIYNDQLYITGSTNIDIDGAGDGLSLGSFDLFVQRLDLDGELVWSKQFGTSGTDYTYGMTINNDLIDILARIETQANMTGSTVIYQMDLDANNLQMTLDSATLGTGGGGFTPIQVDNSGTYYLAFSNGIKKYNSNGTLEAENVEFGSFTDMLLKDDALYISMDATSAYADEVWNDDEAKAVRVVRLRTSDLSVVWSKLIQSDAPYDGLENSNGQLALHNGVVYLSVVAHKELYYQGLELTETPLYTLNLIALNADGEDDSNGNNSGAGYILGQKSWVTGPAHASDDRENPYLANTELSISTAGWLHLSLNVKQNFVSTAQIGRVQTSPYPYYTNSVLMKTQLEVTAIPLTQLQTGISRNNATEIVTDFDHNIQWDDRFGAVFANDTWAVADNTCSGLSLNGEDDWRLPTLEEFMVDGYIPLPGSVFSHYEDPENEMPHWTSEVVNENSHVAVVIGSWGDGFPNDDSLNYRCVRTMP
ncbi:MAG: hypothetical protein ISR69_07285, partial [Gammaproteobacteria bacterium]|nr:hypothetical protein [Gammaproteobacteria bacterium]